MAYRFNEIKLDKGMYSEAGKGFSQVLEELDPSENYKGTPLEGLDAFQRQLKRFDIQVRGNLAATWWKSSSAPANPPSCSPNTWPAASGQGMEENILPSATASVTKINGMDYRSIYQCRPKTTRACAGWRRGGHPPDGDKDPGKPGEAPQAGKNAGSLLRAIRFQRLDLFSVMLRQIGKQIMRMHLTTP